MKLSWDCLMSTKCFVPHVYLDLTVPMNKSSSQSQPCLAQAFYNSLKLWDMICKATNETWWRVLIKRGIQEKKRQSTSVFLSQEPHEQYEKAKRYGTRRKDLLAVVCPICYWERLEDGKNRGQLLTVSERMKWLGQSRNDTQLWMCLVVKVKSDAIKNNVALKHGKLGAWVKVNSNGQTGDFETISS